MSPDCLNCKAQNLSSEFRKVVRNGHFRRKSDCRRIQIFLCLNCNKQFIRSNPRHGQNKRNLNDKIFKLLCSGVSQRRISRLLGINRKTVARKLVTEGTLAMQEMNEYNFRQPKAKVVIFDDLETFEHTKCKPLSVPVAVADSRRILAFEVCQMAANGLLAKKSVKKYGHRKDKRREGRDRFFSKLKGLVEEDALFKSDQNPHYPEHLKKHFPKAKHQVHKGQRGSLGGQGELKKIGFDPLFALNHTCAMFRANINRLIRKTWCTTKSPEKLRLHIALYVKYHNLTLVESS